MRTVFEAQARAPLLRRNIWFLKRLADAKGEELSTFHRVCQVNFSIHPESAHEKLAKLCQDCGA